MTLNMTSTSPTSVPTTIVFSKTMTGPPHSGHGGACAGKFAAAADTPNATVRFHSPIPLKATLCIRREGGIAALAHGGTTIATLRPLGAPLAIGQFGRLSDSDIAAAEARFLDSRNGEHMAPTCFACGDSRSDSLGLSLRPGPIADTGLSATSWRPDLDSEVPTWMIWAALDCPSGAPALAKVGRDEAVVTGELSVEIRQSIPGDGRYQIIGRRTEQKGSRFTTEAAIVDACGRSLAVAVATWVAIPLSRLHPQMEFERTAA